MRAMEQSLTSARMSEVSGVWMRRRERHRLQRRRAAALIRRDLSTGAETGLLSSPAFDVAEDISPDGKTMVFTRRTLARELRYLVDDAWRSTVGLSNHGDAVSTKLTSGSRLMAGISRSRSDESGRCEVYVAPFPNSAGSRCAYRRAGGALPRWSRDGRELFFIAADRHMMSVPGFSRARPSPSGSPARVV